MIAMAASEPLHREQASERTNRAFERLAEPLRRELKLHCYRMLGSLHEAEDLVQETYLRAWRSFDSFEDRGSFRAWLYQIATNVCLNALASRKAAQRLLPDQQFPATADMPNGKPAPDVVWLEPYPDSNLDSIADEAPTPEARYASREAVQLAFVAAIQQLPPRQRAVLLLCDVLEWTAVEAATLLGGSTASVNSALQRARETLAKRYPDGRPPAAAAPDAAQQKLLGRYMRVWEGRDLDGHGFRMVPTAANRQPAFAAYSRTSANAPWTAHSIHVLELEGDMISRLTLFVKPDAPRLFGAFGLPLTLSDAPSSR